MSGLVEQPSHILSMCGEIGMGSPIAASGFQLRRPGMSQMASANTAAVPDVPLAPRSVMRGSKEAEDE